jgi:hypothetical protein
VSDSGDPPLGTTLPGVPAARSAPPDAAPSGAVAPGAVAPGAAPPPPSPPTPATDRLDISALRHPTESSRFALALVASTLVLSVAVFVLMLLGRSLEILLVLLVIGFSFFVLWLGLQLWRVRLLADGVQVSAESLPEVQAAMDVVRARLGYDRRVDVFVVDKVSRVMKVDAAPITLTSFFGVRVIVAEGGALGDLTSDRERQQLVFLLATFVGALKARHTQWSPFLMALELSGLPKLVFLFVYPWYRATVYTGDRIAYACCGDLDLSLEVVYRLLVGKETAPHLRSAGLVQQALAVRRKVILRLAQLLRPVPHATNRYLDLLSFVADREPAAFDAFRAKVGDDASRDADDVIGRLRRRRPLGPAVPLGAVLSALLLLGGVAAGLKFQNSSLAQDISAVTDSNASPAISTPATNVGQPSAVVSTQAPSAAERLVARLPADLRDSCTEATPDTSTGAVAEVDCSGSGSSAPGVVSYVAYVLTTDMQAQFDSWAGTLPKAPCATAGGGRGTWTQGQAEIGPLACYTSAAGDNTVLWGYDDADVLVVAHDPNLTVDEILTWWKGHATLGS